MPQDRTPQLSFNLSRRLISIFLVYCIIDI